MQQLMGKLMGTEGAQKRAMRMAEQDRASGKIAQERVIEDARRQREDTAGQMRAGGRAARGRRLLVSEAGGGLADTVGGAI